PLPVQLQLPEEEAFDSTEENNWQPVLPKAFDAVLIGARAAAPFVFRPITIGQHKGRKPILGSSVPVQHRYPRPVALPPNDAKDLARAHQPWASFALPNTNHLEPTDAFADIAAYEIPNNNEVLIVKLGAVVQEIKPD